MTGRPEPSPLLTDRLDLRPMTPGDLDSLHPIISDPRHREHIPEGRADGIEASRAWIERFSARWAVSGLGYWTVRLRSTGAVIGVGGAERRPRFWIHQDNAASQAVARHLGLADYGQREPQHWNGEPMHYWADRPPAPGQGADGGPPDLTGSPPGTA